MSGKTRAPLRSVAVMCELVRAWIALQCRLPRSRGGGVAGWRRAAGRWGVGGGVRGGPGVAGGWGGAGARGVGGGGGGGARGRSAGGGGGGAGGPGPSGANGRSPVLTPVSC